MSMRIVDRLAQVCPAQWDALLPEPQPFVRHAFLSALEESGSVSAACGWQPAHRLWLGDDGRIAAAMPAYIKQHSFGEYVFDHAWADACFRAGIEYYPKLLCAAPFSPVSGARLLGDAQACIQLLAGLEGDLPALGLSGAHINFTSAACDQLVGGRVGWMQRLGCQFHWRNQGYRDFQDFLETLASRKRKQMRKERENVTAQGLECCWRQGAELNELDWDFIYQCYANTYRVRQRSPYLNRAFFSLLAQNMADSLHVLVIYQQGRAVAMALYLSEGETLYGRYWGALEEFDFLHFEACIYQGIERGIELGLMRFDAGAQGEHKLVRGFEPSITHSWHYLLHPGLRSAVADFLAQERAGVLAYADEARKMLPYRRDRVSIDEQ